MSDFSNILLATDLDGTFFARRSGLVARNLAAVERFKAAGGRFTIATGRMHYTLRPSLGDPAELVNAPAVLCNGAYLYDYAQNRAYSKTFLPASDLRELLEFLGDYPTVQPRVSAKDSAYARELSRYVERGARLFDEGCMKIEPSERWPMDDCYKIVLLDDVATLVPLRTALYERFGDRFENAPSGPSSIELMPRGVSKGSGIRLLRAHFAGQGEKLLVIACGDYENDLTMLAEADLAICPQNACEEAKRLAHAVLCDHDEGLIGDLIERLERGELETLSVRKRGCDA